MKKAVTARKDMQQSEHIPGAAASFFSMIGHLSY